MRSTFVNWPSVVLGVAVAALFVAGCERRADAPQSKDAAAQSAAGADALPAGLALAEAPAGAKDVAAVRAEA
jgi:hypothetical protein